MMQLAIIGAGIAGLVSAALARARGHAVTVVEAGTEVGGLWKSAEVTLGDHRLFLDAGLRLPVATGSAALDDLIFHRPDFAFDWARIEGWPREGAITAGRFNVENSCLDATVPGQNVARVIAEMQACGDAAGAVCAREHARRWYGPTLAEGLVRDAVLGLFETALDDLDPTAVTWFVPRRVMLGDHRATAALLDDPRLAGRVAHARHADLPKGANRPFMHPRQGGISTWVNALHASLRAAGVDFVMGDGLAAIDRHAATGAIARLRLASGRELKPDAVISTVPPALIARAAGAVTGSRPVFRHLRVSHVLIDRAPAHRVAYGLNFSRHPAFFRVIFQNRLLCLPEGAQVLTFEHLTDGGEQGDPAAAAVAQCRETGALHPDTRILASAARQYRNNVPLPTLAAARDAARLHESVIAPIGNLRLVGRSASGAPFLDQIIREADAAIATLPQRLSPEPLAHA